MNAEQKSSRKDRLLAALPDAGQPGLGRNEIAALLHIDRSDTGLLLARLAHDGLAMDTGTQNKRSWTKTPNGDAQ